MDALLSTAPTLTPTASASAASPSTGANSPGGEGATGFGGIFSNMQAELGRQDLAAVLFGNGQAIPQLVSQTLGQGMAVITPDSPTPGPDSLLAFARSQGLNETAIAALWQQTPALASTTAQSTPAAPTLSMAIPAAPTLTPTLSTAGEPPSALALSLAALAVMNGEQNPTKDDPAQTAAAMQTALADANDPQTAALQQLRAQLMGAARTVQRPSGGASAEASTAPLGNSKTNTAPPTLTLSLDLERDLAEITAPATDPNGLPTAPGEAPGTAPIQSNTAGTHPTSPSHTAATPASTTLSGYQLKAEHYQQLAERMGQALAQRMLEQIDQGQWSMKLRLNPVELGQIDVQLDMGRDGLGAYFQTDNPLTKDLILQGSGRLKDNLSQHGMTIASLSVNSDGERQFSGNPTPQQQQRRSSSSSATPATAAPTAATLEPTRSKKSPEQGWDVLA